MRNVNVLALADPLGPDAHAILSSIVTEVSLRTNTIMRLDPVASSAKVYDAVIQFKGPGAPAPDSYYPGMPPIIETISIPQMLTKPAATSIVTRAFELAVSGNVMPLFTELHYKHRVLAASPFDFNFTAKLDPELPMALDIETGGNIKTDSIESLPILNVAVFQEAGKNGKPQIISINHEAYSTYENFLHDVRFVLGFVKFPITHNGKFDLRVIEAQTGVKLCLFADTMLMHHVLNQAAGTHDLKTLARWYLGAADWEGDIKQYVKGPASTYADIPREKLEIYNINDVIATFGLYNYFSSQMNSTNMKALMLELAASEMLLDVERHGFRVDLNYLIDMSKDHKAELTQRLAQLRAQTGDANFNPNSHVQVKAHLANMGHVVNSSDEKTLTKVANSTIVGAGTKAFIRHLLEYRKIKKALGTYVDGVIAKTSVGEDRVHTTFLIHGTTTGRLSSSGPNIQNIPRDKRYRRAFIG